MSTRKTETITHQLDMLSLSRSQLVELARGLNVPLPSYVKPNREELRSRILEYLNTGK